jgi:thiol-disulfide isomerase/thioredoxin
MTESTEHDSLLNSLCRAAVLRRDGQLADATALLEVALELARDEPYGVPLLDRVQLGLELSELYLATEQRQRALSLLSAEAAYAGQICRLMRRDGSRHQMQEAIAGHRMVLDRAAQLALIGQKAPEIEVADWVLGGPTTLAEQFGRVVLLEFWAPSCRPCLTTFPVLRELHSRYDARGLKILALTRYVAVPSSDSIAERMRQRELISKVVDGRDLEFCVGIAPDEQIQQQYGAIGIPALVLIDSSGVVRSTPPAANKAELEKEIIGLLESPNMA